MKQENTKQTCLHTLGISSHEKREYQIEVDHPEDADIVTTLCNHLRQEREGDSYVMFYQKRVFLLEVEDGYRNQRSNYFIAVYELLPSADYTPTDELRSRLFQCIRKRTDMQYLYKEAEEAYAALAEFAPIVSDTYFGLVPYKVSRKCQDTPHETPISFERMKMYFSLTAAAVEVGKKIGMGISAAKEECIWAASELLCRCSTAVSLLKYTTPEILQSWRQTFYSDSLDEDCKNKLDVVSAVYGIFPATDLTTQQLSETDWFSIYRAMSEEEALAGMDLQNIEALLKMSCTSAEKIRSYLRRQPKPHSVAEWRQQLFLHCLVNDSSKYLGDYLDWLMAGSGIAEDAVSLLQTEEIFAPYRKMLIEKDKTLCDKVGVKFATVYFYCQISLSVSRKPLSAKEYQDKIPKHYKKCAKEVLKKLLSADAAHGKKLHGCLRSEIVQEAMQEYRAQYRKDVFQNLKEFLLGKLNPTE